MFYAVNLLMILCRTGGESQKTRSEDELLITGEATPPTPEQLKDCEVYPGDILKLTPPQQGCPHYEGLVISVDNETNTIKFQTVSTLLFSLYFTLFLSCFVLYIHFRACDAESRNGYGL